MLIVNIRNIFFHNLTRKFPSKHFFLRFVYWTTFSWTGWTQFYASRTIQYYIIAFIMSSTLGVTHAQYSAWVIKRAAFLRRITFVHAYLSMHTFTRIFGALARHIGFFKKVPYFLQTLCFFPNLMWCESYYQYLSSLLRLWTGIWTRMKSKKVFLER